MYYFVCVTKAQRHRSIHSPDGDVPMSGFSNVPVKVISQGVRALEAAPLCIISFDWMIKVKNISDREFALKTIRVI